MFTGIITDVGVVVETEQRGDLRARIKTAYDTSGIDIGASIACDLSLIHISEPTRPY